MPNQRKDDPGKAEAAGTGRDWKIFKYIFWLQILTNLDVWEQGFGQQGRPRSCHYCDIVMG